MPSATPRGDVSLTWRVHTCGYRHAPAPPLGCPRPGRWLISGEPLHGGRGSTITPILHGQAVREARR